MSRFPIFLDLAGREALVVGGGERAARKVRLLVRAGARMRVVAPRLGPELDGLEQAGRITTRRRGFVAGDVGGAALVIAATGLGEVDRRVAEAARAAGVPVNVVDRPDLSTFFVPAIVERDPVVVAVCSGGAAPVLARKIRARIEAMLPPRLGELARFAERFRGAVASVVPAPGRRAFWERFFEGPIAAGVLAGACPAAREAMIGLINHHLPQPGWVALVGAGPGDPDLLTLRALRLLQEADLVVHDGRIGPGILDLARRDAERSVAAGDQVVAMLLARARAGARVVRLTTADAEETDAAETLRRAGIQVELVPGIAGSAGDGQLARCA